MTVYARSDVAAVSISEAHGGCGFTHGRPVEDGAPVKLFSLTCHDGCEDYLRSDPHWSATTTEVPETYDEQKAREQSEKSGKLDRENQLAAAIIELGKLGQLPEALGRALAPMLGGAPASLVGQIECPQGHGQPSGRKFCAECGSPMSQRVAKPALESPERTAGHPSPAPSDQPGGKPRRLRDARLDELQALARDRGLDPDGKRPELISRLAAAGVTSADLGRLPVAA